MNEPDVYDMVAQDAQSGTAVQDDSQQENAAYRFVEPPSDDYPHYTAYEFRTRAYNGETPDDNLPMPDRILWWTLREMYARFKAGKISKEQGDEEKNAASRQYLRDRAKYDDYIKSTKRINDLFCRVENAATAYIKSGNRTPEADALYEALYGITLIG